MAVEEILKKAMLRKKYPIEIIVLICGIAGSLIIFEIGYRVYKDTVPSAYKILRKIYLQKTKSSWRPKSSQAYDDPKEDYGGRYDSLAKMEYSSYLGFIPKASYSGNGYKTNNYHFRYNRDFPIKKEENELRIFVTGGSTAWGAGVNQDKLYTSIIEKLLQKDFPDKKIRVISAGVGCYCSTQERITIENLILPLSPDFIIMFSGYNDAYLAYRGENIFETGYDYFNYRKKIENKDGKYKYYDPPRFEDYLLKIRYLIDTLFYNLKYRDKNKLLKEIYSNAIDSETAVKNLLRNIRIINELSGKFNYELIFYLQPNSFDTKKTLSDFENNNNNLSEEKLNLGFKTYNKKIYTLYRTILSEDAQKNNYIFVDGDEIISNQKETLFIDSCHFGDKGNRIIGNHMYNLLKKRIALK